MDLTETTIAKSDQLNADDLLSGPRTFTVAEVREGDDDQPVKIFLAEWPGNRPFKPCKTVRRILLAAWGKESDDWPENPRMTLYRDAETTWAGQAVGGIRVSHLSGIGDQPFKVALQKSKREKVLYTVDPLPDATTDPSPEELAAQIADGIDASTTEAEAREWGNRAHGRKLLDLKPFGSDATLRELVQERLAELTADRPAGESA